jgi:hypothetical protein
MTVRPPTVAYDLSLLQAPPDRGSAQNHGWCYGLPPGLLPEQWPLSLHDGFPMQHCFTLLVPEQYRAQGPAHVALTMFADQQYDEPVEVGAIADYFASETMERPTDAALLPFWTYRRHRHAMEFRMKDVIDYNFAAIWLTEAEFAAPLCQPPQLAGNPLLPANPLPLWLEDGAARTVSTCTSATTRTPPICRRNTGTACSAMSPKPAIAPTASPSPSARAIRMSAGHRAIICCTRASSATTSRHSAPKASGFDRCRAATISAAPCFPASGRRNSVQPISKSKSILAGFNFGGGNGQLDLATMQFGWACG